MTATWRAQVKTFLTDRSESDLRWIVGITFVVKFVFFLLDSLPAFFMGDSGAYLAVALGKWIPPDRSFTYGFIIRMLTGFSHSLNSVVVAQVVVSGMCGIMAVHFCSRLVIRSRWQQGLLAFLFAIDPLQLVYERMIMAETFSLFLYVAVVCLSIRYLLKGNLFLLGVIQLVAVGIASLRLNLIPILVVNALLLPLLGWKYRSGWTGARSLAGHLSISVVALALVFGAYRGWHSHLLKRPYKVASKDGYALAAAWAPLLQPGDAKNKEVAEILKDPSLDLDNIKIRENQKYSEGRLCVTVRKKLGGPRGNVALKEACINAIKRDPVGLFRLGVSAYRMIWNKTYLQQQILDCFHANKPFDDKNLELLRKEYFIAADQFSYFRTLTQTYAQNLLIYYIDLASPLLILPMVFFSARHLRGVIIFILLQTVGILFAFSFLTTIPTPRYLHAVFPLILIAGALCIGSRSTPKKDSTQTPSTS